METIQIEEKEKEPNLNISFIFAVIVVGLLSFLLAKQEPQVIAVDVECEGFHIKYTTINPNIKVDCSI